MILVQLIWQNFTRLFEEVVALGCKAINMEEVITADYNGKKSGI